MFSVGIPIEFCRPTHACVAQAGGAPITSSEDVGTGDVLETILAEGLVESTVTHTRLADDGEGDK